jgi:hypothetical protein
LQSIVEHYLTPYNNTESQFLIAVEHRNRERDIFGNITDICNLHKVTIRPELQFSATDNTETKCFAIAKCFNKNAKLFEIYIDYCLCKARNERLRSEFSSVSLAFVKVCLMIQNVKYNFCRPAKPLLVTVFLYPLIN